MQKKDIINWQDLASSDDHLFSPIKEGLKSKHYANVAFPADIHLNDYFLCSNGPI